MKRKMILCIVPLGVILIMISNPSLSRDSCLSAFKMCSEIIVPSLFTFIVFSKILTGFGFADVLGRVFHKIMKPLFNVSGGGVSALALGMISGYPVGASVVCDLYKNRTITKTEAERLLAFTNNCGPLFVIGAIGTGILKDTYMGLILYLVHIISALIVGVIFRFYGKQEHRIEKHSVSSYEPPISISQTITKSVTQSVSAMLNICAFVITFAVICDFVIYIIGAKYGCFVSGLIEMSTGINYVAGFNMNEYVKLSVIEFLIGFAGLSVHFQTLGVLYGSTLKTKTYIAGKILQGCIGAVLIVPVYFITRKYRVKNLGYSVAVFANGINTLSVFRLSVWYLGMVSVFLAFTYVMIIIFSKIKGDKKNEKQVLHILS